MPAVGIAVTEPTHAAEARRAALRLADRMQFDEQAQGRLALVVTEIATNVLKHGRGGRVLLSPVDECGSGALDTFGVDSGPGMANLAECLRDGFSTAGSPGTGLGAIRRLADESDVYTEPGKGTVIRARCRPAGRNEQRREGPDMDIDGIVLPMAGLAESGDAWATNRRDGGATILVADGLGHGEGAAEAALSAVAVFRKRASAEPGALMEELHPALRGTRGAAAAIAHVDTQRGKLTFVGVGNISASIWHPSKSQHLVSMNGIVGHHMSRVRTFVYEWLPGSILVMHSDGVRTRWRLEDYAGLQAKPAGLIAGVLLRDAARGTDDACVVVARSRAA